MEIGRNTASRQSCTCRATGCVPSICARSSIVAKLGTEQKSTGNAEFQSVYEKGQGFARLLVLPGHILSQEKHEGEDAVQVPP